MINRKTINKCLKHQMTLKRVFFSKGEQPVNVKPISQLELCRCLITCAGVLIEFLHRRNVQAAACA